MNNVDTSLRSTQTLQGAYFRHLYSSTHIWQCPKVDFTMKFCRVLTSLSALLSTIVVQQHENSHSAKL